MPEDVMVPSGNYKVRKRFRNEEHRRKKKDMPWTKQILDLDENRLFGRTAWAWCRIVSFYLVLYFIILMIVICLYFFFRYYFIVPDRPSILRAAPGVSIIPTNYSIVSFYPNQMTEVYPICDRIDAFLDKLDDEAFSFFEEFNRDKLWGYSVRTPTFFVKLNKIIGFRANTYSSVSDLPPDAPDDLIAVMRNYKGGDRIWLTCNSVDGPSVKLVYFPGPYYDADDLVGINRVVAVQISEMPENEEVSIVCIVWAKNIKVDTSISGVGNAQFRIKMNVKLIENPPDAPKKKLKYKVWHPKEDIIKEIDFETQNQSDENLEMPEVPDLEPEDADQADLSPRLSTEVPDKLIR